MNEALEREDTTLRNAQDGICLYINNVKYVEYWVSNSEGNSYLNEIQIGELNDVNISGEMVFRSIIVKTQFKITFTIKK